MRIQVQRVGFAAIVAAGLGGAAGACSGKDAHAVRGGNAAAAHTCIPNSTDVKPHHMALTGTTFAFCFTALAGDRYCFTADLTAKTIAPAPAPSDASVDRPTKQIWGRSPSASIEPSARGKGLTACTANKTTCHDLPIDAAKIEGKSVAVSEDATLVAIDTRSYRLNDTQKTPGRLETWDAVHGKKIASFEMQYGPDTLGFDHGADGRILGFLGHTILAFTVPCSLPCSTATMYSVRGKYIGLLASEVSSASTEHFHDNLYVLHSATPDGPFVVQDAVTGKSVQPDADTNWDAVVTPNLIVRVVGPSQDTNPAPRVEVWGADLKRVTDIAVPMCATASVGPR